MARWILLREDGSVAAQLVIAGGDRPSVTGDNPDGLKEVSVRRHGDLRHEHYDAEKGRWVSDKAKKERAGRLAQLGAMRPGERAAMLMDEIEALKARVAALEAK
jgi:hypothetical protein